MSRDPVMVDLERRMREEAEAERRGIVCDNCGDLITSGLCYTIKGNVYCPDCVDEHFVEDLLDD